MFRQNISTKWQVKVKGGIGPTNHDDKTIHILNRIIYILIRIY